MSKYGLAIHTTTPQLGICLSNFDNDTRTQTWDLGYELSSYLHQYLLEMLQPQTWQDLKYIAVANGPGGFTGTRIGVVTARTLGQQLNIPVFGISTLAAIAWSERKKTQTEIPIALQMDARRGQLFVAIYRYLSDRAAFHASLTDTILTPEAWEEKLASLDTEYCAIDSPANLGATVDSILELAHLQYLQGKRPQWSEISPFYGQSPV
jgi:tRNA threonylcarbamoyl adenosine modification protein YeaZ